MMAELSTFAKRTPVMMSAIEGQDEEEEEEEEEDEDEEEEDEEEGEADQEPTAGGSGRIREKKPDLEDLGHDLELEVPEKKSRQNAKAKAQRKEVAEKGTVKKRRGRKEIKLPYPPADCRLCGEKFDSDRQLGYHIRDVHVMGEGEDVENRAKSPLESSKGKEKSRRGNHKRPYNCDICGKWFQYENSLNYHRQVKHNLKGEEALVDGSTPSRLYKHIFVCDQCGKTLMSKNSLQNHLVAFHGNDHEKPFQCDVCGQRFLRIPALIDHRRRQHTGDRPFTCEHCGKGFTLANRLKCHLRVHSDEKIYKCDKCPKEFKSGSAFRAHRDRHTGEMRHSCKYCGRKFWFQGNMVKHIRNRHPNGENSEPKKKRVQTFSQQPANESSQDQSLDTTTPVVSLHQPTGVNRVQTDAASACIQSLLQPEVQFQVDSIPFTGQEFLNPASSYGHQPAPHLPGHGPLPQMIHYQPNLQNRPPGGCKFCDHHFPDIRLHLADYHRIPINKIDNFLPLLIF